MALMADPLTPSQRAAARRPSPPSPAPATLDPVVRPSRPRRRPGQRRPGAGQAARPATRARWPRQVLAAADLGARSPVERRGRRARASSTSRSTTTFLARRAGGGRADDAASACAPRRRPETRRRRLLGAQRRQGDARRPPAHARSSATPSRACSTFLGHRVIRENHIGDWGTPFGMLIEHLVDLGETEAADELSRRRPRRASTRRPATKFDGDDEFKERARQRVVLLQGGDAETLRLWQLLVDRVDALLQRRVRQARRAPRPTTTCAGESALQRPARRGRRAAASGRAARRERRRRGACSRPGSRTATASRCRSSSASADGRLQLRDHRPGLRHRPRRAGRAPTRCSTSSARRRRSTSQMVFAVAEMAGWLQPPAPRRVARAPSATCSATDRKMLRSRSGRVGEARRPARRGGRAGRARGRREEPRPAADEQAAVARAVGIGAVKYADLSTDRIKDYVFDWDRMLAFDGNTAPVPAVRRTPASARSSARPASSARSVRDRAAPTLDDAAGAGAGAPAARVRRGRARRRSTRYSPHRLCTYLFDLAPGLHASTSLPGAARPTTRPRAAAGWRWPTSTARPGPRARPARHRGPRADVAAHRGTARGQAWPHPTGLLPDTRVGRPPTARCSIGGCRCRTSSAAEYGTPLFVYDEAHLRARCREAVDAFGTGARLRHQGVPVQGDGPARLRGGHAARRRHRRRAARRPRGRRARPSACIVHGNNKSARRAAHGARRGRAARSSSTRFDELDRLDALHAEGLPVPDVLLRITPGVHAHTHEYIATGQDDSKFGFNLGQRRRRRGGRPRPARRRRSSSSACTATSARTCSPPRASPGRPR